MNTPPQASAPEFDIPLPKEHRRYAGWYTLFAVFAIMVAGELAQYLQRDTDPNSKYLEPLNQLQVAVQMRESFRQLGAGPSSGFDSSLDQVADGLEKDAAKNPVAARIYAAARGEAGDLIPPDVLGQLKQSKEPRDPYFAEVFSSKKIDPARVRELDQHLAGGGFISKLARTQAHEKAGDPTLRKQLVSQSAAVAKFVVFGIIAIAFLIGIGLWIAFLIAKAQGFLPRLGLPLERISLADADRLAMRCAQILLVFLGVQLVVALFAQLFKMPPEAKPIANLVIYIALITIVLSLFRLSVWGKIISLRDIGLTKANLGKHIAWGIGAALANLPIILILSIVGQWMFSGLPKPQHPTTVQIQTGVGLPELLVILFAASVGAPIIEEIMFRGTLLPALAKSWGRPVLAILAQGMIFAAIHPTGIPAWLPLAAIGGMSGFLSRQTGSLVPSMVMHSVHNFGTLLFATTVFGG